MSREDVARIGFYCVCGGAMHGLIGPASGAADLEAAFWTVHSGEGHSPTTREKAGRERRKREAALDR